MTKQHFYCGMAFIAMGACNPQADQKSVTEGESSDFSFIESTDPQVKLIALRGPQWSKPDLTYALSACWRFSSHNNISYGRGTCALVDEELELPNYEIDFAQNDPMADCYSGAQLATLRMQEIEKTMAGGEPALNAIALYETVHPLDRETLNEFFTSCKKKFQGLSPDVKLVAVSDYASQAIKLMPGRRKREAMEALETGASIVWPDERIDEKAKNEENTANFNARKKAGAERAIEKLD